MQQATKPAAKKVKGKGDAKHDAKLKGRDSSDVPGPSTVRSRASLGQSRPATWLKRESGRDREGKGVARCVHALIPESDLCTSARPNVWGHAGPVWRFAPRAASRRVLQSDCSDGMMHVAVAPGPLWSDRPVSARRCVDVAALTHSFPLLLGLRHSTWTPSPLIQRLAAPVGQRSSPREQRRRRPAGAPPQSMHRRRTLARRPRQARLVPAASRTRRCPVIRAQSRLAKRRRPAQHRSTGAPQREALAKRRRSGRMLAIQAPSVRILRAKRTTLRRRKVLPLHPMAASGASAPFVLQLRTWQTLCCAVVCRVDVPRNRSRCQPAVRPAIRSNCRHVRTGNLVACRISAADATAAAVKRASPAALSRTAEGSKPKRARIEGPELDRARGTERTDRARAPAGVSLHDRSARFGDPAAEQRRSDDAEKLARVPSGKGAKEPRKGKESESRRR